jgi:hypothetical protein
MVTKREDDSNGSRQQTASDAPSGLEEVFGEDHETATRIMLETHSEGFGICGIYPYDIAEANVTEVLSFARRHGHPLQCVLERSRFPFRGAR